MNDEDDLITYLAASTQLSRATLQRVVADVLDFYRESAEDFVMRRHGELKDAGLRNEQVYQRIRDELARRLVAGPTLSARQVRRLIYG